MWRNTMSAKLALVFDRDVGVFVLPSRKKSRTDIPMQLKSLVSITEVG